MRRSTVGPAPPCCAAEALLTHGLASLDLPGLVASYGLWAIGAGAILEGETMVLLGGFFAHRGALDPVAVWAVAAIAAFAGDQFWFWLGREHGRRLASAAASASARSKRRMCRRGSRMRFAWRDRRRC